MITIEQIKQLTNELLQYCHEYYDLDKPTISDKEYDEKYDELFRLEEENNFYLATSPTRKVQGGIVEGFKKIEHSKPMLSAAKTKDINEIKKFIGNNDFYCSYKLDGLTLVVRYSNGKLVQAITRGSGVIGEDVTEQAKMISNLPMTIPYTSDLELRGECVISWKQFHKVNETLEEPYSHPRNLAAGTLRNLDTNVVRDRKLSYVVFECVSDLYDEDTLFNSKYDELSYLKDVVGFEVVGRCYGNVDDCVEAMQPDWYEYPVDGLIFEFCDKTYSKSLSTTSHHEGCRMALKWEDAVCETTLRNVEWSTTRTGLISPVAVFDEIDLDGALTTRATLHNVSIIKQLELGIGDQITVYRSNMVIPKIDDNLTRSNTLEIPETCPCCGHEAIIKETDNSQVLMCTNPECPAKKVAQFENFVSRKCANIDGMSTATIQTLLDIDLINDFKSIYALKNHKDKLLTIPGFGTKSVENLLQSIENSKTIKLENFICALGIPNIGLSASKTISKACDGNLNKLIMMWANDYDFTQLNDFGEVTAKSLTDYFDEYINEVEALACHMKFIVPEVKTENNVDLGGKTICITGSLNIYKNRDELVKDIEKHGGKVVGSISKKCNYLLTNDSSSGSTKAKKAAELGIPIVSEVEFRHMTGID